MRHLLFLVLMAVGAQAFGQAGQSTSLKGQPIEITSTGGTTYQGGVAVAQGNVAIHVGDTDIYADRARYNSATNEVFVEGNVRIYRGLQVYVGDQGIYNTETKEIRADRLRTSDYPYYLGGTSVETIGEDQSLVRDGLFTTHDSFDPDFRLRATTVRVYENDRVIMKNVRLYIGKVPVFYWPYVYQSLDDAFSFVISPAYVSSWGPTILSRISFPLTSRIKATLRLDYRVRRGVAGGINLDTRYGKNKASYAKLRTYFIHDQNPSLNRTSLPRGSIPPERYRIGFENRTEFGNGFYATANVTKLSDAFVLQDFFQPEFRVFPEPDNIVALTKVNPGYALTAYTRFQVNDFFEATERLPEIALDITRQPVFGSPIFYQGEASFSNLRRNFPDDSIFQDYDAIRLDTFHQLLYPNTYFGWLSIIPRVGVRATYYSESRDVSGIVYGPNPDPLVPQFFVPLPTAAMPLQPGGELVRTVVNAGVEGSFKLSRTWENVQSRRLGLDGLRHIIQPYANFSYVTGDNLDPARILQFDRFIPSTQLRPIDFPQFTSIDSIDQWSVLRLGLRNRLQTRRDDTTINWMQLETYFDVNFDDPYNRNDFSNVFVNFSWAPVPWVGFGVNSQLPLLDDGFTEVNTGITVQPVPALQVAFSHRFLNNNPFFQNSSLYTASAYYRIDDNWAVGASGRYEGTTQFVEEQRYTVYRDLTSWVASLGTVIRNNGGVKEYGVLLSFTLKALPKFGFDLNFDPGGDGDPQRTSPF